MGFVGTLADLIRKTLADEGRFSRREVTQYKRSRRQRAKNAARQVRRARRAVTRARRP
jgi:hypothetical protein